MNVTVTLHEAVEELVERGCTEPLAIMTTLSEQYGQKWLLRQMVNVIAMIAAGRSMVTSGGGRHMDVVVASPVKPGLPRVRRAAENEDVFTGSVWVDERGWVVLRDLTPVDCRTVASQYGRLAEAAERHRDWFLHAAEVAEREQAETIGEVRWMLDTPLAPLAIEKFAA